MYKIFLVEDEVVIRNGIKNSIRWEQEGFEFAGEASDGELAYPLIKKERPDILITDIRMPFMDGLELSRLVKRDMPRIKIVILSGYNEFDYAKTAINLGVTDYLLKPISSAQLLEAIRKVADQIDKERELAGMVDRYQKEMEENLVREQNVLFQYLVTGSRSMQELLEMGQRLQMDLSALWYNIVLLKTQSVHHADTEYSASVVEVEERLKELGLNACCLVFDRNLEGKALLFQADSLEALVQRQADFLEKLHSLLSEYPQIRYFGGIGKPVNRLRELPESFEKASHAFAHRFLMRENQILDSAVMEEAPIRSQPEKFDISGVDPRQMDRGKIREFLRTGDEKEIIYFTEEFFRELSGAAMKSLLFRQYITMDTYFCVADFLEEIQIDRSELESPDPESRAFEDEQQALQYMTRIIRQALQLRDRKAGSRYRDVAGEVEHYIEEHYADEELSLNTLASHVNFSPNHLSMVFAQETGVTFIKYLTDYRMNKAKELLRCTGKKSSEISQEVGYRDPHYFSYLFKKTQGMTPTQYRGRRETEE